MNDVVEMPLDLASLAAAQGCEVVDLRFTDMLGRWLHVSLWARALEPSSRAIPVAGSSVAGWGRLVGSDFVTRPDPTTAYRDPFAARPTLVVIGDKDGGGSHRWPCSVASAAGSITRNTVRLDSLSNSTMPS